MNEPNFNACGILNLVGVLKDFNSWHMSIYMYMNLTLEFYETIVLCLNMLPLYNLIFLITDFSIHRALFLEFI